MPDFLKMVREYNLFSYEEKVPENSELHKNPAQALKSARELCPNGEFICIQLNGSLVVQTYAQIWEGAERMLGGLRSLGLQPGNTIIFQIDTSQDFAPALWSCIMGGFIPVPVPLASDYSQPNQALSRLDNIWQQLDCPTILTTARLASPIHTGLQLYGKKNVKIATIEEIETHSPEPRLHQLQPDELALLLPSSGTTGLPKLIKINSRTFIYRFLKNAINQNNDSPAKILLSWFPLESISGIFTTMPNGFQKNIYLPAELLIRNPLMWLDSLSNYQVTHAQTTNFILSLVLKQLKTNPPRDWDFSSIQIIGIGAEPIVAKTARSFLDILSQYNLNPNVLRPAYGLTECSPIAGSREGFSLTNTSDGDRFVEIGKPFREHSIRIVDQQGSILEEGQIGRIQVQGPSMTSGYYQAPELTRELFTEDGWINTGDLGFLQDGKLTVTGREKETIIINARNYSCQEIELVVEEVEGVEPAYAVACATRQQDSETDELAIFLHTVITEESQLAKLVKQIRGKVTQTLGINPTYIIPIEKEAIPRTATGKIQRLQLKQSLEAGEFDAILKQTNEIIQQEAEETFVAPRDELELQLTKIWEEVLDIHRIGVHDNFFDLGGQSLLAVRLFTEIEKTFQKNLPLAALFQAPTVAELAKILSQEKWSSSWYSFVPIQPRGDKIPLFAIHLLGEGLSFYRPLASYLGQRQPIYGLNYGLAARKGNEEEVSLPPTKDLAAHYIKEMQAFQPQGPYVLLGVSNGGNVAFEMAKQLHAQGQTVAKLILFDTIHPNFKLPPNWKNMSSFQKLILDLIRHIDIHWGNLLLFEPKERLPYVLNKVKNLSTKRLPQLSKTLSLSIRSFVSNVTRKQQEMNSPSVSPQGYIPQAYPGKITLFKAKHTDETYSDPTNGWEGVAEEGLEIYNIHGAHSQILSEPSVRILARKLKDCLDTGFCRQKSYWSSLVPIQPGGSKPPFFCCHGIYGNVLYFRDLALHLGSEQPFYGLQAKGLDGEETPYTRLEDMAAHYIKEIRYLQPSGPYYLGGSSFGGIVALEIAQQLSAQGQQVALLALFDTLRPNLAQIRLLDWLKGHLINLSQLKLKEQLTYIWGHAKWKIKTKMLQLMDKSPLEQEEMEHAPEHLRYENVLKANSIAERNYIVQPYPGRLTLFQAQIQSPRSRFDSQGGWGKIALGGVELHQVPGSHIGLLEEPNVKVLAEKLKACLEKAQMLSTH